MKVGNAVRTTKEWNETYNHPDWTGTLICIRNIGPSPYNPERTHQIALKERRPFLKKMWFDPQYLEHDKG